MSLTPGILRHLNIPSKQQKKLITGAKRPGSPLRRFASGKKSEHITDHQRLTEDWKGE
ncbi:hypothetical protein MMC30_005942 [Trapelia coarctata]|nr:hypothetical protein [Trapelia coarctata]